MEKADLEYLCRTIGDLSGIPIRIYENTELVFYHSLSMLPKDPICLSIDKLFDITQHVGYYNTPYFYFYGVVNSGDIKIVIGPSRQIECPNYLLREIAFKSDVRADETDAFVSGMKSIISMPNESIIQMLCTLNFVLNEEKLSLGDLVIYESDQRKIQEEIVKQRVINTHDEQKTDAVKHNTLFLEQTLKKIVQSGDVEALKQFASAAPAVRAGTLAADQLRQYKNTFIVSATIVSRAAISGGMDVNDAFLLSDLYIQKCELLGSASAILNLQYRMVSDYTAQVGKLRRSLYSSKLVLDVTRFIQHHISDAITVERIAKELYISRTYLSAKFKAETKEKLVDYILREKIDEAKRLLSYTDKPIIAIGNYLGFSSQSHFSRVFKKYATMTPNEYRENARLEL